MTFFLKWGITIVGDKFMVIITEEKQPLVEMAQFKGFGISIVVRSDDHGKFGDKSSPAHAHILDSNGNELAQIELTKNAPKKPADVIWYRTPNPPVGLSTTIIKLASTKSTIAQKAGGNLTVWQNALNFWFGFHEPSK